MIVFARGVSLHEIDAPGPDDKDAIRNVAFVEEDLPLTKRQFLTRLKKSLQMRTN